MCSAHQLSCNNSWTFGMLTLCQARPNCFMYIVSSKAHNGPMSYLFYPLFPNDENEAQRG